MTLSTLLPAALLPGVTALVLLSPTAAQALAVPVNVNGQDYSITTTASTTYNESSALLQSQPWWNNFTLANSIANSVLGQLGTPNPGPGGIQLGPLFAVTANPPFINGLAFNSQFSNVSAIDFQNDQPSVFAIQAPPAAVPGPLPLFGVAAAFGMSRRLRRRIRLAY